MGQFNNVDIKPGTTAPGVYVKFEMIKEHDKYYDPTDYLFQDPEYKIQDNQRLRQFRSGELCAYGVRARAHITHVHKSYATMYTLDSAGLWGVESDSDESYFKEVFDEQCEQLQNLIAGLANPVYKE